MMRWSATRIRRTARIISPDIARTYTMERAKRKPEAEDDFDDALIEAREDVAALHLMENLQVLFDAEAKKLSDAWFADYRDRIKELPHDRQDAYRQIVALSTEPQDVDLARPVSRFEPTKARETGWLETDIPTYKQHLLCDEQGSYPAELGTWEKAVLKAEMERDGFKFWYRNPDRPSQDSLGIAYADDDDTKIVRPDFHFLRGAGWRDCGGHHRSAWFSLGRRFAQIAGLGSLCRNPFAGLPPHRSCCGNGRQAARAGFDPCRCSPSGYGGHERGSSLQERGGG